MYHIQFPLMVNCSLCFIMQNLCSYVYCCACSSTEGPLWARKRRSVFTTSPVLANRKNAGLRHFRTGFTFQTQKLHSSFMHNIWEDCMSACFRFGRIRKSILKFFLWKSICNMCILLYRAIAVFPWRQSFCQCFFFFLLRISFLSETIHISFSECQFVSVQ